MTDFYPGSRVRLSATFRNPTAALADPTTVTLKLRNDSGAIATYVYGTNVELVRDSLGKFHLDATLLEAGLWRYRWEASGNFIAVREGYLAVHESAFV